MAECERTLDGKHHWAERSRRYGEWPNWKYSSAWGCVCRAAPPRRMIPKLEKLAEQAARINAAEFGAEPGEQGRLL